MSTSGHASRGGQAPQGLTRSPRKPICAASRPPGSRS
jgi:hypothetical protein